MARVIRNCWVYRPMHRYKYLPRPPTNAGLAEEEETEPSDFPDRLTAPPKLWMAWVHKGRLEPRTYSPPKYYAHLRLLFGDEWEVGKPKIFPNTASTNRLLWRVKSLVEVRAVEFPHGEPGPDDVYATRFSADGRCWVDRAAEVQPHEVHRPHPLRTPYITSGYIKSKLAAASKKTFPTDEDTHHTHPDKSYFG